MLQPNKNKKKTSWELQQEKLKAEKDAKLKKLLEQDNTATEEDSAVK